MSHRVTNSMMVSNFLLDYQKNLNMMETQFQQMATGRKIIRMSDDPVGVINSMSARTRLGRLEQYKRNIDSGLDWMKESESAAMQLNDALIRAYEYCVDIASDENAKPDRASVAVYIEQLAKEVVQIGNASKAEKFLFAGYNTLNPPFVINDDGSLSYNGVDITSDTEANITADPWYTDESGQIITYEVGFGIKEEFSLTGLELMGVGENNVYGILRDFADALKDPTTSTQDLQSYIKTLQDKQAEALQIATRLGGSTMRMEMMYDRYETDIINFTEIKSRIEDVDEAEAIMNYNMTRAVYEAALSTGAKIFQPTLLNYL